MLNLIIVERVAYFGLMFQGIMPSIRQEVFDVDCIILIGWRYVRSDFCQYSFNSTHSFNNRTCLFS